jgi:hypothetical protein
VAEPLHLPPGARAVLTGPDFLARALASRERDPQRRWILRRSRDLRRDFVENVIDRAASEERWMLLQDEETRRSYVSDVLELQDEPDRQAIWLLTQPKKVRESYIAGVIDV